MSAATAIRDRRLPVAPDLLGEAGLEMAANVAAEEGTVESIGPKQALYSPGSALIVNYEARVTGSDGRERETVVAAVADRDGPPEGAPVLRLPGGEVGVWRFPNDPVLEGLDQVLDVGSLGNLLDYLHLEPPRVTVTPLVYRPTRRAVVRLSIKGKQLHFDRAAGRIESRPGGRDIYLKVVRPSRAEEIGRIHEDLREHLPIPHLYGVWNDLGLLALEGLPGITLRDYIRRREGRPPPAEQLVQLLDTLPATPSTDGYVRSMRRRVRSHARLLRTIVPDHEERVRALGDRLRALPSERPSIVHGDYYDSQVMVDEAGQVTGLLDLDGVGWGDPADDLASMLGRVWTSGQTEGTRGQARFAAYAGELLEVFSRRVDRHDLCMRVAAIVFGRATGPFRMQAEDWRTETLERLDMAELCVEHASRGVLPPTT